MQLSQPIFLIANGRSGTHLVRGMMKGSGQVEDLGEVFNPKAVHGLPQDFFRYLADRAASDPELAIPQTDRRDRLFDDFIAHVAQTTARPYLLFDAKYSGTHHFNGVSHDVDAPPRLFRLIRERGYPVIHLVRRNSLEVHCSHLLAYATNHWFRRHGDGPPPTDRTITVDVDSLVADLERIETRTRFFAWCLRDHAPKTLLFYEDLLEDGAFKPGVHTAVSELLGERLDLPVAPAYAKVSPPLRDYVNNYAEVVRALSGTRFLTMIS